MTKINTQHLINDFGWKKYKNSQQITNDEPTFIGMKFGILFCEHPKLGDESHLIARIDNEWYLTTMTEISDLDIEDLI